MRESSEIWLLFFVALYFNAHIFQFIASASIKIAHHGDPVQFQLPDESSQLSYDGKKKPSSNFNKKLYSLLLSAECLNTNVDKWSSKTQLSVPPAYAAVASLPVAFNEIFSSTFSLSTVDSTRGTNFFRMLFADPSRSSDKLVLDFFVTSLAFRAQLAFVQEHLNAVNSYYYSSGVPLEIRTELFSGIKLGFEAQYDDKSTPSPTQEIESSAVSSRRPPLTSLALKLQLNEEKPVVVVDVHHVLTTVLRKANRYGTRKRAWTVLVTSSFRNNLRMIKYVTYIRGPSKKIRGRSVTAPCFLCYARPDIEATVSTAMLLAKNRNILLQWTPRMAIFWLHVKLKVLGKYKFSANVDARLKFLKWISRCRATIPASLMPTPLVPTNPFSVTGIWIDSTNANQPLALEIYPSGSKSMVVKCSFKELQCAKKLPSSLRNWGFLPLDSNKVRRLPPDKETQFIRIEEEGKKASIEIV